MSGAVSPVSGRRYGLATVCRVWRVARSGVYRHLKPPATPPRRPGPTGPMPDVALLAAIYAVLAASPFHGEGHRKIRARLRAAGTRTSHPYLAAAGAVADAREQSYWLRLALDRHGGRGRMTAPSSPRPWTRCGAPI
jgi:hypothetical protein